MAAPKVASSGRPGSRVDAALPLVRVPDGAEFTGVLRTDPGAGALGAMGVVLGVLAYVTFTPLLALALAQGYWLATGRPGTFADTYASLLRYEQPFGMVASQLGIALLIPIVAVLMRAVHRVRPAYTYSVRPGLRWRPFLVFLGVALVTMNAVLWASNAALGKPFEYHPQPGFGGYLVAMLLTTPLQAAAEEVFFRGYLLQALGSLSAQKWVGILASALVFALFHGTQNGWLFASRFAFGVLAAVLVVYVGGLEAGIAAHVVNNVFAFVYAGLSTGIASLKAIKEVTPLDAVADVAMYAVFTVVALLVARRLRPQTRTGEASAGLERPGRVR